MVQIINFIFFVVLPFELKRPWESNSEVIYKFDQWMHQYALEQELPLFRSNCQCLCFKCLKFVCGNLCPFFHTSGVATHFYFALRFVRLCLLAVQTLGEITGVAGCAPWKAAPVIATSRVFNNALVSIISCGADWHSWGLTAIAFSALLQNVARNVSPAVGIIIYNACPSCVGAV